MIELSRRLFYAIEAVLYIAYNSAGECVSSKKIAAKQGMPPRYLEQMMQKLVHTGILRGVRGPSGGYVLAREKRRISLADICDSLGDDGEEISSTPLGNKVVIPLLKEVQNLFLEQLRKTTIADLYEKAVELNIAKSSEEETDFNI